MNGPRRFVHTSSTEDRKLVFSLLDPGLEEKDRPLIDLTTAFKHSPFGQNGRPGPGC